MILYVRLAYLAFAVMLLILTGCEIEIESRPAHASDVVVETNEVSTSDLRLLRECRSFCYKKCDTDQDWSRVSKCIDKMSSLAKAGLSDCWSKPRTLSSHRTEQ